MALTMAHLDTIPDFASQIEGFRRSDEAREKLLAVCSCSSSVASRSLTIIIQDILQRYEKLVGDHAALTADYNSEKDIRRSYQNVIGEQKKELGALVRGLQLEPNMSPHILTNNVQDNSSFVLGLIDGDGVIVSPNVCHIALFTNLLAIVSRHVAKSWRSWGFRSRP